MRLLSLGTIYRQVIIDPNDESVLIRSRYLWWIRLNRAVRFSEIQAVTYGYQNMSSDSLLSYAHDSYDWFTVGLQLDDDTETHLFNFIGDGTFSNDGPWPDWLYWDEFAFDITGTQEKESRVFVDLLSTMIRAPVVPPRM